MAIKRIGAAPVFTTPAIAQDAAPSAGALNADLIGDGLGGGVDILAYHWVSLHIAGTWTGTLSFQGSNDNVNWISVTLFDASQVTAIPITTTTANRLVHGPLPFRYLRVRMTAYTSGTATAVMELFAEAQTVLNSGFSPVAQSTTTSQVSHRLASAATTNATSVKSSPGRVYRVILSNTSAAIKFVKFYNKTSAPVVGTDTPAAVIALAANGGTFGMVDDMGWWFNSGIAYAITGAAPDADTTAVAANDVMVTLVYS